ncbi:MAG: hypothetical protein MUO64_15175, partial [Anaerolineales bacterium]|nr:hypothetical protein [Anaerolineales bacterium]
MEWQEKVKLAERNIYDMERETTLHFDDLDVTLALMAKLPVLYKNLEEQDKVILLQILVRQITIGCNGKIIDFELHPPFAYRNVLADDIKNKKLHSSSSEHAPLGVPKETYPDHIRWTAPKINQN